MEPKESIYLKSLAVKMPSTHLLLAIALAIISFSFFACSSDNAVTYGGKTYKTVKIGEQVWFAENLNYEAEGSVCYGNNPDNCAKYGRLYNWETAIKICPKGWHLPNNAEWDKLFRFVDGDKGSESPYESPTAGKHLKAANGWNSYDGESGNGTDKYGFSALPGGYGNSDGGFNYADDYGRWWNASEGYSDYAYGRGMFYGSEVASWSINGKNYLFNVRCIKD